MYKPPKCKTQFITYSGCKRLRDIIYLLAVYGRLGNRYDCNDIKDMVMGDYFDDYLILWCLESNNSDLLKHLYSYYRFSMDDDFYSVKELMLYNPNVRVSMDGKYVAVSYKDLFDMIVGRDINQYRLAFCSNIDHVCDIVYTLAFESHIADAIDSAYGVDASKQELCKFKSMINNAGANHTYQHIEVVDHETILNEAPEIYMATGFIANGADINDNSWLRDCTCTVITKSFIEWKADSKILDVAGKDYLYPTSVLALTTEQKDFWMRNGWSDYQVLQEFIKHYELHYKKVINRIKLDGTNV